MMIDSALTFLLNELNAYLDEHCGQKSVAVLSGLRNPDGSTPPGIDNKVVLSLVNIGRETAIGSSGFMTRPDSAYARIAPPLFLNLYVLVSASFSSHYSNALTLLGQSITFLQSKPIFDARNSVDFPPEMDKISMEMVSLNMAELSTLWGSLGTSYLPSAVYKMRMVNVSE